MQPATDDIQVIKCLRWHGAVMPLMCHLAPAPSWLIHSPTKSISRIQQLGRIGFFSSWPLVAQQIPAQNIGQAPINLNLIPDLHDASVIVTQHLENLLLQNMLHWLYQNTNK
ncbi:hypothetical protein TNIN_270831 [Trichonephila inaurata madagascariensis]|uniref:Uncharacterized protein n=1 Tax=Trichonephila inaurata madagascariensis TaxID=2747483 RepID=A0A8X7C893_9ARAC|nr:hypothetical protein TNIN_270811 [Trichonephila inaurata madagascariensis]GFY61443.1 hypothetical protein TNIN_270831 [Trichonephila inaurata madagascariensis]